MLHPCLNASAILFSSTDGDQHGKLGEIRCKLMFDPTGKYFHSTHYCQIVETQSLNQLTSKEQRILPED